jgi:hypothetical protein
MLALLDRAEPFVADEAEAAVAHAAAVSLAPVASTGEPIQLVVREHPNIAVPLPARAVKLIAQHGKHGPNRVRRSDHQRLPDYLNPPFILAHYVASLAKAGVPKTASEIEKLEVLLKP